MKSYSCRFVYPTVRWGLPVFFLTTILSACGGNPSSAETQGEKGGAPVAVTASAQSGVESPPLPAPVNPAVAPEGVAQPATETGKAAPPVGTAGGGKVVPAAEVKTPKIKYNAGEDPEYAKKCGWPVACPEPLGGAILPGKRVVAYYGNPLSKRMGALGEFPKEEMLHRLQGEVARWEKADPSLPVQPALHLIAVVAQGEPGKAGKYRMIMPDEVVNRVYGWAKEAKAVLFIVPGLRISGTVRRSRLRL